MCPGRTSLRRSLPPTLGSLHHTQVTTDLDDAFAVAAATDPVGSNLYIPAEEMASGGRHHEHMHHRYNLEDKDHFGHSMALKGKVDDAGSNLYMPSEEMASGGRHHHHHHHRFNLEDKDHFGHSMALKAKVDEVGSNLYMPDQEMESLGRHHQHKHHRYKLEDTDHMGTVMNDNAGPVQERRYLGHHVALGNSPPPNNFNGDVPVASAPARAAPKVVHSIVPSSQRYHTQMSESQVAPAQIGRPALPAPKTPLGALHVERLGSANKHADRMHASNVHTGDPMVPRVVPFAKPTTDVRAARQSSSPKRAPHNHPEGPVTGKLHQQGSVVASHPSVVSPVHRSAVDARLPVTNASVYEKNKREAMAKQLESESKLFAASGHHKHHVVSGNHGVDHIAQHEMMGESVPDAIGSNLLMPTQEMESLGMHHEHMHHRYNLEDKDHFGHSMALKAKVDEVGSNLYIPAEEMASGGRHHEHHHHRFNLEDKDHFGHSMALKAKVDEVGSNLYMPDQEMESLGRHHQHKHHQFHTAATEDHLAGGVGAFEADRDAVGMNLLMPAEEQASSGRHHHQHHRYTAEDNDHFGRSMQVHDGLVGVSPGVVGANPATSGQGHSSAGPLAVAPQAGRPTPANAKPAAPMRSAPAPESTAVAAYSNNGRPVAVNYSAPPLSPHPGDEQRFSPVQKRSSPTHHQKHLANQWQVGTSRDFVDKSVSSTQFEQRPSQYARQSKARDLHHTPTQYSIGQNDHHSMVTSNMRSNANVDAMQTSSRTPRFSEARGAKMAADVQRTKDNRRFLDSQLTLKEQPSSYQTMLTSNQEQFSPPPASPRVRPATGHNDFFGSTRDHLKQSPTVSKSHYTTSTGAAHVDHWTPPKVLRY